MEYESLQDLPPTMRDTMPREALDIYLEAYKEAWEDYQEHQGGELNRHSVAHQKAMAAVKREYVKDEETGKWYVKGEMPEEEGEEAGLIDKVQDALGL